MNIYVVGNIVKDVYLSIDSRTENLETDRQNIKWLSLSFDASKHRYFHRISNFGGAAVSKEVLTKMGLSANITNPDNEYRTHRYILTSDDSVCYLCPTKYTSATFIPPETPPDYLYIDRSANLNVANCSKIKQYLDANPNTSLVIYLKDFNNRPLCDLAQNAKIIFIEGTPSVSEKHPALISNYPTDAIIYIDEHMLNYQSITEMVRRERIDKLTHLSAYSIASATILGSIILGKSIEEGLRLARANLENSTLDSCLTLHELQTIASVPPENLELIAITLTKPTKGPLPVSEITASFTPSQSTALNKALLQAYTNGFRIADWKLDASKNLAEESRLLADCAKRSQSAGLVPVITINPSDDNIKALLRELLGYGVNLNAVVFKDKDNYSLASSASAGALPLSDGTSPALTGSASAAAFSSASRAAASAAGS